MRTIKNKPCPPAPTVTDLTLSTTSKTYTIRVVTPLFGGGVETGTNDPVTLIRPSSIRGHLRFWWRATRGAAFSSVKELRQREAEIWGTTENPSSVVLTVRIIAKMEATACAEWRRRKPPKEGYALTWYAPFDGSNNPLPYALFPFQGEAPDEVLDNQDASKPAKSVRSAEFELKIELPTPERMARLRRTFNEQRAKIELPQLNESHDDIQRDIEAAVWAWANFGGIGARTRRGCGALYCKELAPPSAHEISNWFKDASKTFELSEAKRCLSWPTLRAVLVLNESEPLLQAWRKTVGLMREFRQGKIGRDVSKFPPGRSYWPEADSLRAITKKGKPSHLKSITLPSPVKPAFPRAELGLPIVFHFKDSSDKPNDCVLYAYDHDKADEREKRIDRMASPLILRPLACGDSNQAVAMVVSLRTLSPAGLELENINNSPLLRADNIHRPDLARYPNSPMGSPAPNQPSRSTQGSALDAFLAYTLEQGFQEHRL